MKPAFEIKRTHDEKFMFNLKAANDEIVLTSQPYTSKEACEHGIASVKENAALNERYEEKTGTNGKPYFVLHAANKLVIGKSQLYASREDMHKGIASVKKNGPIAEVVDWSSGVLA